MMDNRTIFSKVKRMIEEVKKDEITLWELEALIMQHVGGMQSTIQQALRTLGATGLIKDIGMSRFKIIR